MSRPAPSARACHGVTGRTSPSTTGANGIDRYAADPSGPPTRPSWRHRITRGGQPGRGDRRQVRHGRPQPQLGGAGRGDVGGELGREERARHALRDRPAEQAGRARHRQQRGDRPAAGRLAEDGDAAGSPPNARMLSRTHASAATWSSRPRLAGAPVDLPEALDADAVVERHHDDAAVPREAPAVVLGEAGHADRVGAAVDPDHHRQPRARARIGRPDVDRQPVVARRLAPARPCRSGGLRRRRSERRPPGPRPSRGPAAARRTAARRPAAGERDAPEDGHAVLPAAAKPRLTRGRRAGPGRTDMPAGRQRGLGPAGTGRRPTGATARKRRLPCCGQPPARAGWMPTVPRLQAKRFAEPDEIRTLPGPCRHRGAG